MIQYALSLPYWPYEWGWSELLESSSLNGCVHTPYTSTWISAEQVFGARRDLSSVSRRESWGDLINRWWWRWIKLSLLLLNTSVDFLTWLRQQYQNFKLWYKSQKDIAHNVGQFYSMNTLYTVTEHIPRRTVIIQDLCRAHRNGSVVKAEAVVYLDSRITLLWIKQSSLLFSSVATSTTTTTTETISTAGNVKKKIISSLALFNIAQFLSLLSWYLAPQREPFSLPTSIISLQRWVLCRISISIPD